jgi:hypothetical protein
VGEIVVEYCPTGNMLADYFTKPLQGLAFQVFRDSIMNIEGDPALQSIRDHRSVLGKDNVSKANVGQAEPTNMATTNVGQAEPTNMATSKYADVTNMATGHVAKSTYADMVAASTGDWTVVQSKSLQRKKRSTNRVSLIPSLTLLK